MWNWIFENIKGKHQEKKLALKNDDEYIEFMLNDFNRRLQFAMLIGTVIGFIMGALMAYGVLEL